MKTAHECNCLKGIKQIEQSHAAHIELAALQDNGTVEREHSKEFPCCFAPTVKEEDKFCPHGWNMSPEAKVFHLCKQCNPAPTMKDIEELTKLPSYYTDGQILSKINELVKGFNTLKNRI